jgi:hypothetical protein
VPSREDRRREKARRREERRRRKESDGRPGSGESRAPDELSVERLRAVGEERPSPRPAPPPRDPADRLVLKTGEYLDRGFTVVRQTEIAVDLVREHSFSFSELMFAAVVAYPHTYGVTPRETVSLLIDGDRVQELRHSAQPDARVMVPVGSVVGLYCVFGLLSMGSAILGTDYLFAGVHSLMLGIGGYGLWIFARAALRMLSGNWRASVALPEVSPKRRRALDQTPAERLLGFLDEELAAGYVVTRYQGQSADLLRPEWWPSRGPLADFLAAIWRG